MSPVFLHRAVYRDGFRTESTSLADDLATAREYGDRFLWISLKDPTEAEFAAVNDDLQLHPLAVEDAINGKQRAKVERYGDTMLTVIKTLKYIDATSDIETGEIMVFVGDAFIVTVRRGDAIELFAVRDALEADPQRLRTGPSAVLHAIMDHVVDVYGGIDRAVHEDLEEIEHDVFTGGNGDAGTIYRLKREVLEFRRAADPLREATHQLQQRPLAEMLEEDMLLFFRDIEDHLGRVCGHLESYDKLLTDVLQAHLAHVSVKQNEDMRKISAWVGIAAVPTMIAGIYGMNFQYMPELVAKVTIGGHDYYFGYFVVVGIMLAASVTLFFLFKKWKWL